MPPRTRLGSHLLWPVFALLGNTAARIHVRSAVRLLMSPRRPDIRSSANAGLSEPQPSPAAPASSRKRTARSTGAPAAEPSAVKKRVPAAAKKADVSALVDAQLAEPLSAEPASTGRALAGDAKSRTAQLAARDVIARTPTLRLPPPAVAADALTFVSWNVNGLRSWLADEARSAELASTALHASPDVIFLLETKLSEGKVEETARAELEACLPGYTATFCSATAKKGYSGVAALVRTAAGLSYSTVAGIGECDDEGRALTLQLRTPGAKPLDVICAYVPNSGDGLKRLQYRTEAWDPALRRHVLRCTASGRSVCLLGDLNVAHLDADIWNWGTSAAKNKALGKNAGLSPEERASFSQLLSECALTDAFRHRHPEASGCFSYWSVRASGRPVNRGLRLDYALVSADIAAADQAGPGWGLHDCFMLDELNTRGDHAAIAITLVRRR